MGQVQGKHYSEEFGGIFLKTDQQFYYGGDTVTGNIYMDLKKEYPGNQIFLHLKGKEKCWWEERR